MTTPTTAAEWYRMGLENGWCTPQVCVTHDGYPMTAEEEQAFDETLGDDCLFLMRLVDSDEHRQAIEANFSPAVWRNPT